MVDHVARKRRALRARDKRRRQDANMPLLYVFRSSKNIYAQVKVRRNDDYVVLASASTLDPEVKQELSGVCSGNQAAAKVVGRVVAKRAKSAGISKVACDRSGFRYHGRVKSLVDAARDEGLEV